jgi:hypothetical protein
MAFFNFQMFGVGDNHDQASNVSYIVLFWINPMPICISLQIDGLIGSP